MILPGAIIGGGALSAEFQGVFGNAANQTSYTFASTPFGAASSRRYVLVAISGAGSPVGSTVTFGGVAATQIFNALSPQWWLALVPTGTSGDIVITNGSGTSNNCKIAVWAVYHLKNLTPTDSAVIDGGSNLSPQNIDVQHRGLVLAAADGAALHTNISWTGITEAGEATVEARQFSTAGTQFSTAQTVSVGCTGNGAGVPIATIIALR